MTKINTGQATSGKLYFGGRYYVYALINPVDNTPFYIGKGEGRRLMEHFREPLSSSNESDELIGLDTKAMLDGRDENADSESEKQKRIKELANAGYDHTAIARVIARRVNEQVALAIEACLIKSVYGANALTNQVAGHHPQRFRDKDNWEWIDGFDSTADDSIREGSSPKRPRGHYVYLLRDPRSEEMFYVGKGTANRIDMHFSDARQHLDRKSEKLERIRELLAAGIPQNAIARVLARVETESQAHAIETLYMKFVFGHRMLSNDQQGHAAGLFRARGDWHARKGFDLPFIVEGGRLRDRQDALDIMLGAGLDAPLLEVAAQLEDEAQLNFCKPMIMNSGELGLKASVDGMVDLKIFIRHAGRMQAELRPNGKTQKVWMREKFGPSGFNSPQAIRSDAVFFPAAWRGSRNMTIDIGKIVSRGLFLIRVARAKNLDCFEPHERKWIVETR